MHGTLHRDVLQTCFQNAGNEAEVTGQVVNMAVGKMIETVTPGKMQAGIDLINSFCDFFGIFKQIYLQPFSAWVNSINKEIGS